MEAVYRVSKMERDDTAAHIKAASSNAIIEKTTRNGAIVDVVYVDTYILPTISTVVNGNEAERQIGTRQQTPMMGKIVLISCKLQQEFLT